MTLQKTSQSSASLWAEAPIQWLQPVQLPVDAWSEFSHELTASLDDLEQRFAPIRPLKSDRITEAAQRDER